jgi:UDP-N-acetylmuramate dehydrogenase
MFGRLEMPLSKGLDLHSGKNESPWASPSIQKELKREISGDVFVNVPMSYFTSFRVGGPADLMALPRSREDLKRLIQKARAMDLPFIVIGNGTNLIVKDRGIRGLVIRLVGDFEVIEQFPMRGNSSQIEYLRIGAGASIKRVLSYCMKMGYGGLEFSVGIPATFGGAVVQNAGTDSGEIQQVIKSISIMDANGMIYEIDRERLSFSYRYLELPPESIVVDGIVGLKRIKKEELVRRVKEGIIRRRKSQPLEYPSAGSIFKNPDEAPAGKIIDELGLKGLRVGDAQVSFRHANFIINLGNAMAWEILELIEIIKERVLEKRGINLDLEVKILGE